MRTNEQIDKLWSEDVEKVLLGSIMVDPAVLPAVKTVIGDERAFFLVSIAISSKHLTTLSGQRVIAP